MQIKKSKRKFLLFIPFFLFFSLISLVVAQSVVGDNSVRGVVIEAPQFDTVIIQNQTVQLGNLTDTNATTACTGSQVLFGNGSCGLVAGSGDITSVQGDIYITNGSNSGDVNLVFNETLLNDTIDNRAGSNVNIFDQVLNQSSNVTFAIVNITTLLDINGTLDIEHDADHSDDHAIEIDVFAQGFADVKALFINYITGILTAGEDASIIFINIDQFLSTGGDVVGLEVVTTEGSAKVVGLGVGVQVDPIEQLSGIFTDMDSALDNTVDVLSSFISTASDVAIFENDDETVTIGNTEKFEEIEFIFDTVASGAGISPEFYYSTGLGTWGEFSPADGTNGMRDNGIIIWLDSDIPSWATNGSEFLIRINRTQNGLGTVPIEDKVQISAATEYFWNKDGDLSIRRINASSWINVTITESQISDLVHTTDTNETQRLQNLTTYSCSGTDKVIGVALNGTVTCGTDSGGTDTNETNRFQNLTSYQCASGELVIGIELNGTVTCATDADTPDTTIANETNRIQNLTTYECQGTDKVIGVELNGTVTCGSVAAATDTNETVRIQNLTTYQCGAGELVIGVEVNGTVTCAVDADTADTNETQRFQNLTTYSCSGTDKVVGVELNGTVTCGTDDTGSSVNVFDQTLNTTSNVSFGNVTSSSWFNGLFNWIINTGNVSTSYLTFNGSTLFFNEEFLNATIDDRNIDTTIANETNRFQNLTTYQCAAGTLVIGVELNGTVTCATDSGATDTNETQRFQNLTTYSCSGTDKVVGVELNGTVTCAADQDTADTTIANETVRLQNITGYDCTAGNLVIGFHNNGTVLCAADSDTISTFDIDDFQASFNLNISDVGVGNFSFTDFQASFALNFTEAFLSNQSNIFDQDLNISNSPTFSNLTIAGNLTVDTNTLIVDSGNDRVGIGTATPDTLLNILGAASSVFFQVNNTQTNSQAGLSLANDAQTWSIYTETNDALRFHDANNLINVMSLSPGSTLLTISIAAGKFKVNERGDLGNDIDFAVEDTSGNDFFHADSGLGFVGIGTNSPAELLSIVGGNLNVTNSDTVQLTIEDSSANGIARVYTGNDVQAWSMGITNNDNWILTDATAGVSPVNVAEGTFASSLFIRTTEVVINHGEDNLNFRVASDTDTNAFVVNAGTSRVGIGTVVPAHELTVVGNINITGANNCITGDSGGQICFTS